jgi:hypothetical protein
LWAVMATIDATNRLGRAVVGFDQRWRRAGCYQVAPDTNLAVMRDGNRLFVAAVATPADVILDDLQLTLPTRSSALRSARRSL